MNQGTKIFYAQGGEVRKLDDGETVDDAKNGTSTSAISSDAVNSTETVVVDKVSFKTANETNTDDEQHTKSKGNASPKRAKGSKRKNKKQKQAKKAKNRVNREILTTLLSRKKLYKMLEHKLEMCVQIFQ